MTYKIHRLKVDMISGYSEKQIYLIDENKYFEDFLNELKGEVIAIIPNVDAVLFGMGSGVNYLFVVEREAATK